MTKATDHRMSMCSDREYNLRERIKTIYEALKAKDYADLSTYCREGEQNIHRIFNIHPPLLRSRSSLRLL